MQKDLMSTPKLFGTRALAMTMVCAFLLGFFPFNAAAQQGWNIKQLDASSQPQNIVPDTRAKAAKGLPDGRIATAGGNATIRQAWYSKPTRRYDHGILGDKLEGGSLVVVTKAGKKLEYTLPKSLVFEDITPHLSDLDGDGKTEVITIISSLSKGGSLGIFQVSADELQLRNQSPYIGRSYRWLNIAGINRYSGGPNPEIAIVVTPHIGGRLDLYKFNGKKLSRTASAQGFSNHFIGSREQRLSASYKEASGNKFNLALPSADRRSLKIMTVAANGWQQIGSVKLPSPIDKAIAVSRSGKNVTFTVGLSNGSVYSVSPN